MSILTINTLSAPAPTSLQVAFEDAQLSVHATLSGATHVSRAGVKRRISIFWAYMTPDHLQNLLTALHAAPTCTLSFPDPLTGAPLTVTAYSTQRSVGLYRMKDGAPVWTNVELSFMEC
ncbi:MAG: hypothetical protein IKM26_05410 [Clostridia bacterium]|nr:hypothetical protein [Clostridia bacterium]MBR6787337.1 hypothetical protein [Clostridia bacterium]